MLDSGFLIVLYFLCSSMYTSIPISQFIPSPYPDSHEYVIYICSMVGKHLGARKDHPGLKAKENDENCGPTTTVFVGNISEKASDMLIRQLLAVS